MKTKKRSLSDLSFKETFYYMKTNFWALSSGDSIIGKRINWFYAAVILNIFVVVPASILIGVALLIRPMDTVFDSLMTTLTPFSLTPVIFILFYWNYKLRPEKLIKKLENKFPGLVGKDSFTINDNYLFFNYMNCDFLLLLFDYKVKSKYSPNGKNIVITEIRMPLVNRNDDSVRDKLNRYVDGKSIARHMGYCPDYLFAQITLEEDSDMYVTIIKEMIYITNRFNLQPFVYKNM